MELKKISVKLNAGYMGDHGVLLIPNDKKTEDKHPDFKVVRMINDKWRECGAAWVRDEPKSEVKREAVKAGEWSP